MADKKISQLTAASQVNSDAVFPLSQIVSGSEATVKATAGQVGDYIANNKTYAGLNTSAKDLIGAINEVLSGGGGGGSYPSMVAYYQSLISSINTITHTFSEAGTYQFYILLIRSSSTPVSQSDITITLNGTAITPNFQSKVDHGYIYGEITVSANDVLTVSNTVTENNRAMQLSILKNANISNFSEIGYQGNNGTAIPYTLSDFPLLEGLLTPNKMTLAEIKIMGYSAQSFAVPGNTTNYYYAKVYAIKL